MNVYFKYSPKCVGAEMTELENLRFAGGEGKQAKYSDKGGGGAASALQLLLISVLSVVLMWDVQTE